MSDAKIMKIIIIMIIIEILNWKLQIIEFGRG